jgi:CheY-like chemotaxis protein
MAYVLAIEPNREHAELLRECVGRRHGDTVVVESVESAMPAIERELPSLILVSALLPPRDEQGLIDRLRTLPWNAAPEILITPSPSQVDAARAQATLRRRLFDRRARAPQPAEQLPRAFDEQLSQYLEFAEARRSAFVSAPPVPEPSPADRRASLRVGDIEWARARINGTPVKLVDLSITGAQILSPTVLRLGGSVHVMLSRDQALLQCDASIVWGAFDTVKTTETPLFRAGINFSDADPLAIEQLWLSQETALAVRENRTGSEGKYLQRRNG